MFRAPVQGFLLTCLGASLRGGRPRSRLLFDALRVAGGLAKGRDRAVWAPVSGFFLTCLGARLRAGRGLGLFGHLCRVS